MALKNPFQTSCSFLKFGSERAVQLPLQVERSIYTLIQPPLSEKIGTSPEPPKIFIREGSHGLIFDMYVLDNIFLQVNIPFWTMPDKNFRSSTRGIQAHEVEKWRTFH